MFKLITLFIFFLITPLFSVSFVYDNHFSPDAGAKILYSLHQDIYQLKHDYFDVLTVNNITFESSNRFSVFKKRSIKYLHILLIDGPLTTYLSTWQHEYFGHAYRMREQNWHDIKVVVNSPWPYVSNPSTLTRIGGYASGWAPDDLSDFQFVSMFIEGINSQYVLGQQVFKVWFDKQSLSYSKLLLANINLDAFLNYTLATTEEAIYDENTANDLSKFLDYINYIYGYDQVSEWKLTLDDIQMASLVNFLSPQSLYIKKALIHELRFFKPMKADFLTFKDSTYFPNWNAQLSPFGLCWNFELWLKKKEYISRYFLQINNSDFSSFWACGVQLFEIPIYKRLFLSFVVNVWRQPDIFVEHDIYQLHLGGLFKTDIKYFLSNKSSISINLGYKTEGYAMSYFLKEGAISQFAYQIQF